jgi:hypothetical protein
VAVAGDNLPENWRRVFKQKPATGIGLTPYHEGKMKLSPLGVMKNKALRPPLRPIHHHQSK